MYEVIAYCVFQTLYSFAADMLTAGCLQVTSPKSLDALRVALTPVKRENSLLCRAAADAADDDQETTNNNTLLLQHGAVSTNNIGTIFHNAAVHGLAQASSHHPAVSSSTSTAAAAGAAAGDKLSGTTGGTSSAAVDVKQHHAGQQCVYCALTFKSKGELERHVKTTHVIPTSSQKCNICDEVFPSAAVLAEHKLTHCKVKAAHTAAS